MIFKKPYAFLIKYFKLINLILSILSTYIAYKAYNIVRFFNEYITNNYTGNYFTGYSDAYISPFIYLVIIIILIGLLGVYLLFIYKKKPAKVYISSLIYYVIYIIFLIYIKDVMINLETAVITAETSRLYRDLSVILFIPQIFLIISYLIRGFGFNIKKFNFEQDLKELEISESDNEEVEFILKKNDVKVKRNIKRFIREFKYYIKENKFILFIILIIIGGLSIFLIYKSFPEIVDRNYNQGDTFSINNITYKIEDSIITNLDYNGNIINNDNYYLVVKIYIENNLNEDVKLDYNDFRLLLNEDNIYPTKDKGRYFIDYAVDYYKDIIKANSKGTYSMVYMIKEQNLKKNYKLKISNGSKLSDNVIVGSHYYINITPIIINKVNETSTVNINEELILSDSNLGNTKLKLSNAIITDKYIYDYKYCITEKCNIYKDIINIDYTKNYKTLVVLDYEFEIDTNVPFYNYSSNIKTFIKTFMKIRYKENNEIVYAEISDVTPNKLKDKIIVETTNKIKNSETVELSFIIRNKEYIIKLK